MTCSTCKYARQSPTGKVCCVVLNDHRQLGLTEDAEESDFVAAWSKFIPKDMVVYQGWGCPQKRYNSTSDTAASMGMLVNNLYLVEPDGSCPRYE